MRKLFCLLSTVLLLFGCNDVDEFGLMLPDSVTLDEVRPISELTYEELDSLVDDVYLREEMRRNGGLLVQARANASGDRQYYDYLNVFCEDDESMLPSQTGDYWSSMPGVGISEFGGGKYYVSWGYDALQELPGTTIYCEALASLMGGDQMPGFVDEIRDEAYYSANSYVFSDVRSYTYPDAPLITEFNVNGGDFIQASFHVPADRRNRDGWGICYSTSNPLPTLDDVVTYVPAEYDHGTYANVVAQVSGGTYNVRAFAIGTTGEVSYSPVQRVTCQGLMASVQIDSLVYVADIPYNTLADYLPTDVAYYQDDLRVRGGALVYLSASVEGNVYGWDMGLSVSATGVGSLPTEGYDNGYGAEAIWKNEDGNNNYWTLYWQPASNFAYDRDRNDFHYQAAIGVYSTSGYMVWSYSDTVATVWNEEPVIESVHYYGENPLAVSMDLTTWGYTTNLGVCYSTTNDLPTLEQNDGVAECPDTNLGYGVNSYYEFTLPAGTYYVRAYARSEGGLTYAPVQQVTVTEDMTTR